MGLGTTHGCWHGSYGRFSEWRNAVAQAGGYAVRPPIREYREVVDTVDISWENYVPRNYMGVWDTDPEDVLLVLIVHADCEGFLYQRHLLPLADRLESLLPLLDDEHQSRTLQFISGLRDAAEHGENVEFH